MLQRAASNAYSWWWASNIRTNQSKWLDNNLQEMEDRVKAMLKIIEEDAESFAKRAEMYYKRRPELISHVEETYRAYRAIAERYDRISGELHKANHTLATAFPDVQFPMEDEDEDDDSSPNVLPSVDSIIQKMPPEVPEISLSKPPAEVPKISLISKKSENKSAPKNSQPIPALKKLQSGSVSRQMSEDEAKEAINRLQKGILILQTEKEFIKSSYESGVAKYWEIENKITEMQEEVCFLEDEYNVNAVIEDDEARALMAVTALKSCKDTLVNLQEQRKRSKEETRVESERIRIAKEKLKALKSQRGQGEKEIGGISDEDTGTSPLTMTQEEASDLEQESLELQSICEKVNDHFEINSDVSVVDLADKIDELVNKVISLELTVSSQTAQIQSLRSETDDLQKHLRSLEEDKSNLIDDSNSLSGRLKQAEEELHKIQNLEKRLKSEKSRLRIVFTEACQSLSDISEKLQSPRPNDQVKTAEELKSPKHQDQVKIVGPFPSQEEDRSLLNMEPQKESVVKNTMKIQDIKDKVEDKTLCNNCQENQVQSDLVRQLENDSRKCEPQKQQDELREHDSPEANGSNHLSTDPETQHGEEEDAPNLQQLLLEGLEGREKILLAEYTSILQTYKDTKRKLLEVEKKNQEYFSETMSQVRELKSANAIKDDEINTLRQILNCLQTGSNLKRQSEMLEDLNVKGTSKSDASSGIQDRGNLNAEEDITLYRASEPQTTSVIEEKFRRDIDTLLDENLEFWLRFSTSFHQIQRFRTEFQNLQDEIEKLKDSKMQEASNSATEKAGKPESTPIEQQLRELKTELQVWVEQNALLRRELQSRFSSLCNIQEEISGVLKESSESGGVQFTQYQAAKFQGEVLNMQQENNKVADELQSGLDHVKGLQVEVEKTFSKLHEKFELSASKRSSHQSNQFRHFATKTRGVPLRSFLYGVKPKKPSIFSCMSPALQKQYSDLRAGMPI